MPSTKIFESVVNRNTGWVTVNVRYLNPVFPFTFQIIQVPKHKDMELGSLEDLNTLNWHLNLPLITAEYTNNYMKKRS